MMHKPWTPIVGTRAARLHLNNENVVEVEYPIDKSGQYQCRLIRLHDGHETIIWSDTLLPQYDLEQVREIAIQNAYQVLNSRQNTPITENPDTQAQYIRIPVKDQPRDRMYEMSLRFTGNLVPIELNDLLSVCGNTSNIEVKDAITLRITQTVPFIPDDTVIKQYAETLTKTEIKPGLAVTGLRFDGYDYIHLVRLSN